MHFTPISPGIGGNSLVLKALASQVSKPNVTEVTDIAREACFGGTAGQCTQPAAHPRSLAWSADPPRPHSHLGLHPQGAKPPEAGARLSAVHRLLTKQHSKHGPSRPFPALDQRVLRPQSPPGPCPGCGSRLRLRPRRSHPPTFTLPPSGAASPPRPASPRRGRLPPLHPPSGSQKDSQRAGAAAVARWGPDVPDGRG